MIDIREHGGMYGGGSGGKIEFPKVTWSLTEPASPKTNDLWIKKDISPGSVLFDDVKPALNAGQAFFRVVDKEQVPKASKIKKGPFTANVTPQTPTAVTPSKIPYVKTDYMDIHGRLGQVYYSDNEEKLDAFLWDGAKWIRIGSSTVSLFATSPAEYGVIEQYDIAGALVKRTTKKPVRSGNYRYYGLVVNPEQRTIFASDGSDVHCFDMDTLDIIWEANGYGWYVGTDTDVEGNFYTSAVSWANGIAVIGTNGALKTNAYTMGNYTRYSLAVDSIKGLIYVGYTATNYSPAQPQLLIYSTKLAQGQNGPTAYIGSKGFSDSEIGNVIALHVDKDGDVIIGGSRNLIIKARITYDGEVATYQEIWRSVNMGFGHSLATDMENNVYALNVSGKKLNKLNPTTGAIMKTLDLSSYTPFTLISGYNPSTAVQYPINIDDKNIYLNLKESSATGASVYLRIDKDTMEVITAMPSQLGTGTVTHSLGRIRNFANKY